MIHEPDRLYDLLPAVYRQRDADQGYPQRALLRVIAEQVDVVEDDITQLYANWFIETAQDWVVPYIGELVGYRPVHVAGDPAPGTTERDQQRNKILTPRREVANTIRYRRRKGTLALLEQLAGDVAGWPARAVEFYRLLGWLQNINYLRPQQGRTADLRRGELLDLLDSPFDPIAHTVDVRRASSHHTQGRFNIPSIGLFVWRLKSYTVTQTPAYCLEEVGPQCYTFSVLGNEMPLYIRPDPEEEPTHIAEELNVPAPIRRRALEERILAGARIERTQAAAAYYGEGKSITIWAPDWPRKGAGLPIPREEIIPADLSDWRYRAPRGRVAVDSVLGRIVFPANRRPTQGVWVSYQYAFSADIGGGEYERPLAEPEQSAFYRVGRNEQYSTIKAALDQWAKDRPPPDPNTASQARSAVIEIIESGVYTEQLNLILFPLESLQIRAASGARPVIRLLDYMAERPDAFSVAGGAGSRFTLDGLLVAGRGLRIYSAEYDSEEGAQSGSDLCDVTIRHCTFVPGWALGHDCEPKRPNEASIVLENTTAALIVEHSIVGTILVTADQVKADPNRISISDSIVDATNVELAAIGALTQPIAFGTLTIARTTVIGQVQAHAIDLAENSIFYGLVRVARRQRGCVRFCWVAPGSRTPRRFACQPEAAEQAAEDELRQAAGEAALPSPAQADIDATRLHARDRVRPQFSSLRYGTPTYCQLAPACAEEITRGADDESEVGAFHDLYQPQRAANLRARLDEYTPAGMDAGIFFAS
jgi:hypothetical protein